jgi:outer membrane protein assembly factor BamB
MAKQAFERGVESRWLRFALAVVLGLEVPVWTAAGDWPQFLGPGRDGVAAETGLASAWPKKGPPVVWEKKVGAGFSGPVAAGGNLIVFHRLGNNEVVECLDAATGAGRWQFSYATGYQDDFGFDEGPRSTPLIAGPHVYTLGAEGRLHCLDMRTGQKVWERSLNTDYRVRKGYFGVGTSPLLEGELLLVNVGGKGAGIVALDRHSGREVWKATDHEASYSSPVAATIAGVRHLLFFTREGLVSLDPKSGAVRFSKRWRSRLQASVNAATPLVLDGHVFLSASYNTGAGLFRVRADGVDEVWTSDDVLSSHYTTSVRNGDFLFGFDGRQEYSARLRCVEWKTGKVRWTVDRYGCGSMILADGKLLILGEEGDLVLAEPVADSYREKARAAVLGKSCRAQIALADGRLYARDTTKLICLNLKP